MKRNRPTMFMKLEVMIKIVKLQRKLRKFNIEFSLSC